MQFQTYKKYKRSGIDSLGDIPKGWEVKRFSDVFTFNKGLSITKENLQEEGIYCVNYGEIHSKYGFEVDPQKHKLKCVDEEYLKLNKDSLLKYGDFVFADTSEDIEGSGNFTYLNSQEKTFAGYHTIIAKPIKKSNYRFIAYLFDTEKHRSQIRKKVTGIKVFSITKRILKDADIFFPDEKTQTTIATYLDQQTALIDKKIELLKAKKQSYTQLKQTLTNEVVTKGLDKTVEVKESGIEWIGQIPKHWEVKRLKDLGFLYSGLSGKSGDDFHTDKNETDKPFIPFTNIANNTFIKTENFKFVKIFENEKQNKVRNGDLFFLMSSENYEDIGKNSLLINDVNEVYLNSFCKGFRFTTKNIYPKFINYLLLSRNFRSIMSLGGKGFIRINLSLSKVNDFQVILPPKSEQIAIARYLDEKTSKIDQIITKIDENILALQEFRKTLINEVVTGKVKVL